MTGHWFGHPITEDHAGVWRYTDNGNPVAGRDRECGHCGERRTPEGHDPCLGTLPGVMNACCGHGIDEPYVQLEDGDVLSAEESERLIREHAGGDGVEVTR